jgi:hypothetical protein
MAAMNVRFLPDARPEFRDMPEAEQDAMRNAVSKLEAGGDLLGYPHSSRVRGAADVRELRPRAGRSPWRAFYRRVGEEIIVAAFGPEAAVDPQGFERAVSAAARRLHAYEDELRRRR